MLTEKELTYIEEHAQEVRQLLLTLARIPAPSHHEEKRAQFCKHWLEAHGAKNVVIDDALNVVYPIGVTEDNPVTVFMAHMDVVFPDTEELPLTVKDGKIFCPGIGDDTANLVALLMAAGYVTEQGLSPDYGGVVFVCNSCEEGLGNLKGSRKICDTYGKRIQAFYTLDLYLDRYVTRSVGSCRYRVKVTAEGGHSYLDFGKENAIARLAEFIGSMYQIQVPREGRTTYNVGTIQGGTSVNTIAQQAEITCEFRSDCRKSLEEMETRFYNLIEEYQNKGVSIEAEVIGIRPCEGQVDAAARQKMFDYVEEAIFHARGIKPGTGSSSTDCNIPLSLGIPAVCFGACRGKGFHTREEFVYEDSLIPGYQAALEIVLHYFLV